MFNVATAEDTHSAASFLSSLGEAIKKYKRLNCLLFQKGFHSTSRSGACGLWSTVHALHKELLGCLSVFFLKQTLTDINAMDRLIETPVNVWSDTETAH